MVSAQQSWPAKPIRIVVASTAGSSIDIPVRIVADQLKDRLGQPIVVENKPQAAGTLATGEVARAAPDGYTYVMSFNGPLANAPHLYTKLPYDPLKDLTPVIQLSGAPFVLGVPASLGVNSVKELLDMIRKQPGRMNYSSLGNGSGTHLTMELLKTLEKLFIVHIPYAGGPAAAQAVATGEVQAAFMPPAVFLPHVKAGRVKLLAVSTRERFPLLADLPTIAESGVAGFDSDGWNGIMAPAGTPKEIVARMNSEINQIIARPEVREQFAKSQLRAGGGTAEQFGTHVAAESKKWGPVIKYTGLKLD
jgi:tripartite-type tricarboxylate transporter receptor subunit TctC